MNANRTSCNGKQKTHEKPEVSQKLIKLPASPLIYVIRFPALHPGLKCTSEATTLYNASNYAVCVQWADAVLLKCSVSQKSREIAHNHSVTGL